MKKVGIFYGSESGNTKEVCQKIAQEIGDEAEVFDVSGASREQILGFDNLILASATYGSGDLQDDWEKAFKNFNESDFASKVIALVGVGDGDSYSDTFCDSIYHLYEKVKSAKIVGRVNAEGYIYDESLSVDEGEFLGLAIDEENQSELTEGRIKAWVKQIKGEFI
ncbi:flavodoxin [Helicobacter cholecystus]|uniref:flavodoxin n=1 Tax=Helicobacter cholecystus TaxID=45498 RepID=UPI002738562E|nr:flavodoxin [Helicobacter cholecystus]